MPLFGITSDFAATPNLDVLAVGIEDGIAELLAAVRSRSKAAKPLSDSTAQKPVNGSITKGSKSRG